MCSFVMFSLTNNKIEQAILKSTNQSNLLIFNPTKIMPKFPFL